MHVRLWDNDLYRQSQVGSLEQVQPADAPAVCKVRDALMSDAFIDFVSAVSGRPLAHGVCTSHARDPDVAGRAAAAGRKPGKGDVSTNGGTAVDVSGFVYQKGDMLLCHDDRSEERSVAYVLYLPDEDWEAADGGALDLIRVHSEGDASQGDTAVCGGAEVVTSIIPGFGHFIMFAVSDKSLHRVAEVLTATKARWSISGWFHRPPQASDMAGSASQSEQQRAQLTGPCALQPSIALNVAPASARDRSTWGPRPSWLNARWWDAAMKDGADGALVSLSRDGYALFPNFFSDEVWDDVCDEFEDDGIVSTLPNGMLPICKNTTPASSTAATSPWRVASPPGMHHYCYMDSANVAKTGQTLEHTSRIIQVMESSEFVEVLDALLALQGDGERVSARSDAVLRWFPKGMGYSLLQDSMPAASSDTKATAAGASTGLLACVGIAPYVPGRVDGGELCLLHGDGENGAKAAEDAVLRPLNNTLLLARLTPATRVVTRYVRSTSAADVVDAAVAYTWACD